MHDYFEPTHISSDNENQVMLATQWRVNNSGQFDKIKGYVVHTQSIKGDTVNASTVWFLPHLPGYRAACDYVISERQRIWGDSAP